MSPPDADRHFHRSPCGASVVAHCFRRILKRGKFPKGRTTKAMNPASGAATPSDARTRLMAAHERFETGCRAVAARGLSMNTPMFGAVAVKDFVRFMELHTRHHNRQIA